MFSLFSIVKTLVKNLSSSSAITALLLNELPWCIRWKRREMDEYKRKRRNERTITAECKIEAIRRWSKR
jgi:hypothetical protein